MARFYNPYCTVPYQTVFMGTDSTFLKSCPTQYLSLKWWREECKGSPALPDCQAAQVVVGEVPVCYCPGAALHRLEASLRTQIHFMLTKKQISLWSSCQRYRNLAIALIELQIFMKGEGREGKEERKRQSLKKFSLIIYCSSHGRTYYSFSFESSS